MADINNDSQYLLEKEILQEMAKLGFALYAIPDSVPYHKLVAIQKKLNEYFDNTRLLQTQIKGNVTI